MADKTAEHVLQVWDDLESDQRLWLPHWQEIADFTQTRKSNIIYRRSPGQQQNTAVVDSTAQHALELLAASMQGALTSDAFPWFSLRLKGIELARDHAVSVDLEACADDMRDAFKQSNAASEFHEIYLDTPGFGTGALFIEERTPSRVVPPGSLRFTALPPGSFAIDEDGEGFVDTVYRKLKLSARAAATEFGVDKIGDQVRAALKKNSTERFEFVHAVYPRSDQQLPLGRRLPATKFAFASLWVDVTGRALVRESGYQETCIVVPRWAKTSGEKYGRGPGSTALPDIKTLNKAIELKLKAWAKTVDPPIKVRDEGVIGTPKLANGGITYVRDMDAIQPLTDLGGRLDVADMQEEKLRQAIRRMFFSDQLQLQEGPQMTAYEVQVRYELMQRVLGPTLGRLTVEFLNPLIERVFWIRLRASAPDSAYRRVHEWCRTNGVALDIEYEGPLARAQRMQESMAVQRFFQIVLPLVEVKPDVLDAVDLDTVVRLHALSVGVPERVIRSAEAVSEIRAARAKAQEDQAALQGAGELATAGGKIAPLIAALGNQKEGTIPVGSPALASG